MASESGVAWWRRTERETREVKDGSDFQFNYQINHQLIYNSLLIHSMLIGQQQQQLRTGIDQSVTGI